MRILPQKTTSFAYNIHTNTLNYGNHGKNNLSYITLRVCLVRELGGEGRGGEGRDFNVGEGRYFN